MACPAFTPSTLPGHWRGYSRPGSWNVRARRARFQGVWPELDRALARVRSALGDRAADPLAILTLADALAALGQNGVDDLGQRHIPIDQVVGTVCRSGDFDRRFRLRDGRERDRWQRIARLATAGAELPPVDV